MRSYRSLLCAVALVLGYQTACSPVLFQKNRLENRFHRYGLSEHFHDTGEATIHYWKGGEGPPLFLLHGFGADALWTWHPQIQTLIEGHQLIVPDLIWFGESFANGPEYSLEFQAETFLALLEHEGIEQADLMGISYGGLVVFQMLEMKPTVLNRLIIVDSPGPVFTQADRELMLERMQVKSAAEVVIPESADDVQKLFRLAYFKPPKLPKFLIKDTFEHLFTKYVQEKHELLQYLENNQDALTTEEWTIDRPTLLVWGEQDPLFPVELGHRLAEKIGPNATMHVIPQARHAPNIEYPELFNKAVAGFLDRTE